MLTSATYELVTDSAPTKLSDNTKTRLTVINTFFHFNYLFILVCFPNILEKILSLCQVSDLNDVDIILQKRYILVI